MKRAELAAYAKHRAVVDKASAEEIGALLQHQSPVVRGYMARHVAHELAAKVDALVPLSDDTTTVDTLDGCIGGSDSVGSLVREALCSSPLAEASAALVAIHRRGGPQAAAALTLERCGVAATMRREGR